MEDREGRKRLMLAGDVMAREMRGRDEGAQHRGMAQGKLGGRRVMRDAPIFVPIARGIPGMEVS